MELAYKKTVQEGMGAVEPIVAKTNISSNTVSYLVLVTIYARIWGLELTAVPAELDKTKCVAINTQIHPLRKQLLMVKQVLNDYGTYIFVLDHKF